MWFKKRIECLDSKMGGDEKTSGASLEFGIADPNMSIAMDVLKFAMDVWWFSCRQVHEKEDGTPDFYWRVH